MHFTPTGASWLNMVERFFRDITDKRIRRDSGHSGKGGALGGRRISTEQGGELHY